MFRPSKLGVRADQAPWSSNIPCRSTTSKSLSGVHVDDSAHAEPGPNAKLTHSLLSVQSSSHASREAALLHGLRDASQISSRLRQPLSGYCVNDAWASTSE